MVLTCLETAVWHSCASKACDLNCACFVLESKVSIKIMVDELSVRFRGNWCTVIEVADRVDL